MIFFERLKDEIREGRTFRSAVPRAGSGPGARSCPRTRSCFLAAAVLYVLAVGQVKGFAFTLGMSTVLDLVVVFFVTHPLVALASKSKLLSSPSVLRARRGAADRRANARTRPGTGAAVKEA